MLRPFHKMHGLGNDFVVIDARKQPVTMDGPLARAIADRQTGVGCDQLILLEPSDVADVRMRIFNHDGSEVGACGNAARCVVLLTGPASIETDGGILDGAQAGEEVEVVMGEPRFEWDAIPLAYAMDTAALPMAWDALESPMAVNVGNPHLIFFVDDVTAVPLDELGPRIEHDPAFPERINVNVAAVDGDGLILRTWERGAGLTRACGTGACASAVAAIVSRRLATPVKVTMPGGSLTIAWAPGETIRMRGPARQVFEGQIDLDALRP
jgi:diaminopimelate epimerase